MKNLCRLSVYSFLESLGKPAEFIYIENIIRHFESGSFNCPSKTRFDFTDSIFNFFNTLNGKSCCKYGESMSNINFSITSRENMHKMLLVNKGVNSKLYDNKIISDFKGLELPPILLLKKLEITEYHEVISVLLNNDSIYKYNKINSKLLLISILKLLNLKSTGDAVSDYEKIFTEFDLNIGVNSLDNTGSISNDGYRNLYILLLSFVRCREIKLPVTLYAIEDYTNFYIYSTAIDQININEIMSTPSVKELTYHVYNQLIL